MPFKQISLALALACCFIGNIVRADDLEKPIVSVAGFGTVGLTHSSDNQSDFTSSNLQPNGAGFTNSWSASVDTRLGVQLTGNFTPYLSAVLQVISKQRYNDSYAPTVEWANLKYQVTPDLSVRLGRVALPTFLTADYRNVGYAIAWVRPPGEVYDLVPITNSDGIDLRYRMHFGDLKDTVQASFGTTSIAVPGNGHVDVRAIRGLTNTSELGSLTVRLTYLQGSAYVDLAQPLFAAFQQFGPQGMAVADKYSGDDKPIVYTGLGINYDPGDWFAMAELGNTRTHSFLGEKTAGYVSVGYRFGKLTPYLTFAQVSANSNRTDPGLSTQGLPPQIAGEVFGLNAGLNSVLGRIAVQKSISLGLRWDVMKNAALKVQYDLIRPGSGSPGDFANTQPGFSGRTVDVFSTVLDFVF